MPKPPYPERFEASYIPEPNSGCWLWTASANQFGYGRMHKLGRTVFAHRVAYELYRGPIPDGMFIDHLCRVRCCVNPAHLEPVTHRENTRRGQNHVARKMASTHCQRGHELSGDNLRIVRQGRQCRICTRIGHRQYRLRAKLRKAAAQ